VTDIRYRVGNDVDFEQYLAVYVQSTLGERRPIADLARMRRMLEEANLLVTAWDGEEMVGLARSLTDFVYATYLSDLAVKVSHQKSGIGRELMRRTQLEAPQATLILLSAPAAEKYYPHVGFTPHHSAWIKKPGE
jgi:predicted N-acetyltransferase YhbS